MASMELKISADSGPMLRGLADGLYAQADMHEELSKAYREQAQTLEVRAIGEHTFEYASEGPRCLVCGLLRSHAVHITKP